jgi:hypothetical protein
MTNEELYDAEVAPILLKAAQRCKDFGFSMIASVEFGSKEGDIGRTEIRSPERPSAQQLLVHYASRCNGNVDSMLMQVIRDCEKYGHSSMYLHILGVPEKPVVQEETKQIS